MACRRKAGHYGTAIHKKSEGAYTTHCTDRLSPDGRTAQRQPKREIDRNRYGGLTLQQKYLLAIVVLGRFSRKSVSRCEWRQSQTVILGSMGEETLLSSNFPLS